MEQDQSIGNDVTLSGGGTAVMARIDQYEIYRKLGGGGFGSVYFAKDTVAGIDVAVKGLPPVVKNNTEELERIRENFALVSRLHHPYIAAALHLQKARDVAYNDMSVRDGLNVAAGDTLMVMEYAPGVTLTQWTKQFPGRVVPVEKAVGIVTQIAEGLDYAHSKHILHRDIKPSNVMIETSPDGEVTARLLDFGLAAEMRSSMGRVSREVHDTSGTRPYMAPEQWAGEKQGPATDQYALAVVFCELVTGEVPFESVFASGDPAVMLTAVCGLKPSLPCECPNREAILRAMARHADDRFDTCTEFVASLRGALSSRKPKFSCLTHVLSDVGVRTRTLVRRGGKFLAVVVAFLIMGYCGYYWWENYVPVEDKEWTWKGVTSAADKQALECFRKGDFDEGFRLAKDTDSSNAEVLYYLAECYESGNGKVRGLDADSDKAEALYIKAVDKGFAPAMVDLAGLYGVGYKVEKNLTEAERLCQMAMRQGYPRAYLAAGLSLKLGIWSDVDCKKAMRYFEKGAGLGSLRCREQMGTMYGYGDGVEKNVALGVKYLTQAMEHGLASACVTLAGWHWYENSPLPRDAHKALDILEPAIDEGSAAALCLKGKILLIDDDFIARREEGLRFLEASAEKGDHDASELLGGLYENGFHVGGGAIERDLPKALKYYRKACAGKKGCEKDVLRLKNVMRQAGYSKDVILSPEEMQDERNKEKRRLAELAAVEEREARIRKEMENAAAEKRKFEEARAAEAKALADKKAAERESEERLRQEADAELVEVMNAANKIFSDLRPTSRFEDVVAKIKNISAKHPKAISLIASFVGKVELMSKTEKYIWDNVRGCKLSAPYDGIVESYKTEAASLVLKKMQGKTKFTVEIPRSKFYSERVLFEQLTNAIIINGKKRLRIDSAKWAELVVGVALIVKHFPCGESSRDTRVRGLIERVMDDCLNCENSKIMIREFLARELDEVEESRRPPTHEEAYAKTLLGGFSFDIHKQFQIGPSLKARLRSMKAVDDAWVSAAAANASGRYLDVLSIMAGQKISTYPSTEEIDRLVESFRKQRRRIVLDFKDSYDYVKCFTFTHCGICQPEAVAEGRIEKIDERQGVLYASVGDGKKYLTTMSVYYGLRTLAYHDYSSKRRTLEKKLENSLIGKQEFESQILNMNKSLYEAMVKKAKTE